MRSPHPVGVRFGLLLLLGCGQPSPEPSAPAAVPAPAPAPVEPVPAPAPSFRFEVEPLGDGMREAMTGVSWRQGCPTPLDDLRLVTLTHHDFDGGVQIGRLVVHHEAVEAVRAGFRAAWDSAYPIRQVVPVHEYGGSDDRSMAADNTSAFNCRPIKGTDRWSEHSSGRAIDINPRENPWVKGDKVDPPEGIEYLDRDPRHAGVLTAGHPVVDAFAKAGWSWGGRWQSLKDYQHFSESGR